MGKLEGKIAVIPSETGMSSSEGTRDHPARSAAPVHRPTTGDSAGRSRLLLQNRQQPTQVTRIKPRLNHQAPATAMP